MMKQVDGLPTSKLDLAGIREAFLAAPEEAVFLERARILRASCQTYRELPPGLRQGRTIADLCAGITPIVEPVDVLLARVREEVPAVPDEAWVEEHPELFLQPGVPGWLEATSIYLPDWRKLLSRGLGGLLSEVEESFRVAETAAARDELEGIRLSLEGISHLCRRYAQAARETADLPENEAQCARLRQSADVCEAVACDPPQTFQQALQLFTLFHMVLSCVIGGRDITPGRMDQYLRSYYERDLAEGRLSRQEAVELLAAMMLALPQLSGPVATDFQSTKRTPTRYSHYYITLGGVDEGGQSAVNELSHAFLEARRLVDYREPTLVIRWFEGIERDFWLTAVGLMRDGLPVFPYHDNVVVPALVRHGVPEALARGYAHSACMLCLLPGHGRPPMDDQHNAAQALLCAMTGGGARDTGELVRAPAPKTSEFSDFDSFFEAFREQLRDSLARVVQQRYAAPPDTRSPYPLPVRLLVKADALPQFSEQRFIGLATVVDSLLAVKHLVYEEGRLSLDEFVSVLSQNFTGREDLREFIRQRLPAYGSDDPEVLALIDRVGRAWVEAVTEASASAHGVVLRPTFHSWLFNIEQGAQTAATPDGRLAGEPLSIDFSPSQGRGRAYTESLRALARVPHHFTCSGGTPFRLSPSHFEGEEGVERLAALLEGYFGEGGLQLHFVFADAETLREAVAHPEQHADLLIRVTGFSEYFVRLLPEVQQEIIRRAE